LYSYFGTCTVVPKKGDILLQAYSTSIYSTSMNPLIQYLTLYMYIAHFVLEAICLLWCTFIPKITLVGLVQHYSILYHAQRNVSD